MFKYFSADYILPVSHPPLRNGVVALDETGKVAAVYAAGDPALTGQSVEKFEGLIVPGFVNSHCHLELSHLHQKIKPKQSLIPFIQSVIGTRAAEAGDIESAMLAADKEMRENGIVAVADVSNNPASRNVKLQSDLYYHTFVELICFEPEKAKDVFRKGLELLEEFQPLKASIAAHAPYSVCKELFRFIGKFCGEEGSLLSIHNQESEEENKFYRYKTGEFNNFYSKLGMNIAFFKPQARNSLQSFIPLLPENQRVLLVHNTYTSLKDIYFLRRSEKQVTWCFCPNANLYIEDRLPKVEMFMFSDFNITIGTDSLASNSKLCILSELKTLHDHFPTLKFTDTLAWATLNGAKLLGIDNLYGSIEPGKTPGLNLIRNVDGLGITPASEVVKLA
jgi:aminodeoxyfutalosine deaminase